MDTRNFIEDLEYMVSILREENVLIFPDDAIENVATRFDPAPIWCILLTVYGGLLIVP
jgi:hypothetical protein